jgi:hypothetical protein
MTERLDAVLDSKKIVLCVGGVSTTIRSYSFAVAIS